MAHGFGNLAKVYGIISYSLSPYEQKTLKGFFSHGVPNVIRRIRSNVFTVGPPFVIGYCIYEWAEAEFKSSQRKNPADFANDV